MDSNTITAVANGFSINITIIICTFIICGTIVLLAFMKHMEAE